MDAKEPVDLTTLAGGAANELFGRELDNALRNIMDVNTPPKAKRTITLKVEIVPDEDRTLGEVTVSAATKFPAVNAARTRFFMGRVAGKYLAVESDPKQMGLFGSQSNVVPLDKGVS